VHSREREQGRGVHYYESWLGRRGGGEHTDPAHFRAQILQLYVAAYQAPGIWKEAWKHLVGVISVQIIRDVESFVASHPFAEAEVMRFLMS
jgi:hypothetical protein